MIQLVGVMFITLLVSALPIDLGYYFAAQNRLQTAADSAALAAAAELYRSRAIDPGSRLNDARNAALTYISYNEPDSTLADDDIQFGFIDPAENRYNSRNYTIPSNHPNFWMTKGYNSVFIRLDRSKNGVNSPLRTIMGNFFGVRSMDTEAHSIALMEQTVHAIQKGGLRPIYICEGYIKKAMEDGILDNNLIRIYEDHVEIDGISNVRDCPPANSGNWSFADFRELPPREENSELNIKTLQDWFELGYSGKIEADTEYRTARGEFISQLTYQLNTLIDRETVFPVPFYADWDRTGARHRVTVAGFVGFQITDYKVKKQENRRYRAQSYIEGYFQPYVCNKGCTTVSNGFSTPGGAVVKFRLAPQS